MTAKVTGLIPMAHVADMQRAIDFYNQLGMGVRGSLRNSAGELVHLACDQAELVCTRASEPVIASQQAVLSYFYSPDLIALRGQLLASG